MKYNHGMKILVLDVPGLHLGYLGCYGNEWVATPNIDRLASESVVFGRHIFDVVQPNPFDWTGWRALLAEAKARSTITLGQALQGRDLSHALVAAQGEGDLGKNVHDVTQRAMETVTSGRSLIWTRFPSLAPPWMLSHELLDSYCEEEDEPWPDPPHGTLEDPDDLPRLQNTYAAAVTFLDAQLGALFDEL